MVEPGGEAGLTHRTPDRHVVAGALAVDQPLDGHLALQQVVVSAPDLAHATPADQLDTLVATADHSAGVACVHHHL